MNKKYEDVEVLAIGGYGQLIANMTALLYNKKILLIDTGKGFKVPQNLKTVTPKTLGSLKSIQPNFKLLTEYLKQGYTVEACIITHCHGDHMGGFQELIKFLQGYGIPKTSFKVYTTQYTFNYGQKSIQGWPKENTVLVQNFSKVPLDDTNYFFGFYLNHSSLHSLAMYFNINNKKILFLPDHRIDYVSTLGPSQVKIDQTFQRINSSSPDLLILEGTQISSSSLDFAITESSVCQNLKNLICFLSSQNDQNSIIVSTYATNPERLVAVINAAKLCGRRVYVLGRGMMNGISALFSSKLMDPSLESVIQKNVEIVKVNKNKKNYVILTTGHMGQNSAGLSKMLRGQVPFAWSKDDCVILSSRTIPKEGPRICRSYLKSGLMSKRIKIYDADTLSMIHTSGHITYKDFLRYLKEFTRVKKIIINHSDLEQSLGIYKIIEEAKSSVKIPKDKVRILLEGQVYVV